MTPINNFAPVSTRLPGGCWPTPAQTLLLRACLLERGAAVKAWEQWTRTHDFEAIDSGSFRLLGLAHRHLAQAGISGPLMPRLQGVYRRFWTANQLLLGRNAPVLRRLAEAGIPVMLTKGAALTVSVYRDYGTRPMDDLDLMVPRSHALPAMEVLENLGWEPEVHHSKELPETLHACHFRRDRLGIIDLHWRHFHLSVPQELDAAIWDRSMSCSFHGIEARVPDFSDQFLRACEHGVRYNIVPPFRWLADCFQLWNVSEGELDWERIAGGSRQTESVLAVKDTMRFLRDQLGVPLPEEAFGWVEKTPVTFFERVESRLVQRPCRSLWDKLPVDISWHLRSTRGQPWGERISGFRTYFRHANNLTPGQFTAHYCAQVQRWLRCWLPYYLRRIPRLLQRPGPGAVRSLPEESFWGFHEVEPCGHRLMRWSLPTASLGLKFGQGSAFKIIIDTGRLRSWTSDLSQHVRFALDGEPIPPEQVKGKQGMLTLRLYDVKPPVQDTREVRLSWECRHASIPGETRPLGLPVFAVTTRTLKRA